MLFFVKQTTRLAAAAAMLTVAAPTFSQEKATYDVVVYGATASGVATAVAAAREGATVVLLEPTKHVGGMVTGGLSGTDFGNKKCIGAFALDFYERLGKHYNKPIEWYAEPGVAEQTLNAMLKEQDVPVKFGERLKEKTGVASADGKISGVTMESGNTYEGKVFIDCSYEGDLMAQAGVKYFVGREGDKRYGETLAGVRERTPKHQFEVKVKARDENGKLLPGIQDVPKGEAGAEDKKVQAYNFRICMTKRADIKVPFPKPPKYDPAEFKLLANFIQETANQTGSFPKVANLMHPLMLQGEKTDTNNRGAFSTDYLGGNWNYPDASYAERQQIWDDHYNYVAGFLYFLANDASVPVVLRNEMNEWGLAGDEFKDTDNWPRQLYVREGRRMIGEYVMTQADIQTSRTKDDVIGMGSYTSDSHNVTRIENAEGFAENEGDMQVKVKPYQIPYRLVLPRRAEATNLLVPVCFSASHVAYSTLRMEPQYMIIGEASGVAAAMAVKGNGAVHDVDTGKLTARLRELRGVMELPEEPAKTDSATTATK